VLQGIRPCGSQITPLAIVAQKRLAVRAAAKAEVRRATVSLLSAWLLSL